MGEKATESSEMTVLEEGLERSGGGRRRGETRCDG